MEMSIPKSKINERFHQSIVTNKYVIAHTHAVCVNKHKNQLFAFGLPFYHSENENTLYNSPKQMPLSKRIKPRVPIWTLSA